MTTVRNATLSAALLSLLPLSGCTKPAPAMASPAKVEAKAAPKYPRLATGSEAVVYDHSRLSAPDGRKWRREDPEFVSNIIEPGARLIVLDDDGPEDDDARMARVAVQTSTFAEHVGNNYRVARADIRPMMTRP